ncbi:MAG: FkbM family methyltransferase [Bacteroidota bacterium]|nr:FkbM family methyltransferase [Bacteroidota bacterium]
MIKHLIHSFKRKIARRVTKKYPVKMDTFNIPGMGHVEFANWENPLVAPKVISGDLIGFFRKFINEGDLAIDIGANIGHISVTMSLITGKKGRVLSFDPNPFVFEILKENAKLNADKTCIEPYNFAITDHDESFYYNSSEASFNNGGISREMENRHGKYSLSTKIKGINLEAFLLKNYPDSMGKIKLIKIDTEGYDMEIIKSISGLLNTYHPTVITECFGKTNPEERYMHFDLLKSKGYSVYFYSDFDVNATIIPIEKKEDMLQWKHFDMVAIME